MAQVTAGAAYKGLKRSTDYISPQVNAGADRLAANARQQKQINAADKARQEARMDKAFDAAEVDVDAFQTKVTGFDNRDDIVRDYAGKATERAMEYSELAREAAANQDWKTHRAMVDKKNRIKGDFKNAVNDEKFLTDLFTKHQKSFVEGKIDDDDWLDFMVSMEGNNYEVGLDENDNRVITALVEDSEGKMKKVTKRMSDIVNGKERPYEKVEVTGKGGLVDSMLVGFGKRKYDSVGQNYITTTQVWDDRNEAAFNAQFKGLQSNDRTMYSLLKQASSDKNVKKEDFTDADKKLVRDYLYDQVKAQYGESTTKKVRSMTVDERAKESELRREVTKRGQDLSKEASDERNRIALERQALSQWKAENPTKKAPTKEEASRAGSSLAFEIATKISNVTGETEEEKDAAIKKIGDEFGLQISANSDWFGENEFNLGKSTLKQSDPHGIAKAIATKMGYKYDATYAQQKLSDRVKTKKVPTSGTIR